MLCHKKMIFTCQPSPGWVQSDRYIICKDETDIDCVMTIDASVCIKNMHPPSQTLPSCLFHWFVTWRLLRGQLRCFFFCWGRPWGTIKAARGCLAVYKLHTCYEEDFEHTQNFFWAAGLGFLVMAALISAADTSRRPRGPGMIHLGDSSRQPILWTANMREHIANWCTAYKTRPLWM